MLTCVPSGIRPGSTATTPQPVGSPVDVCPARAYPVAKTVSVRPAPAAAGGEAGSAAAGVSGEGGPPGGGGEGGGGGRDRAGLALRQGGTRRGLGADDASRGQPALAREPAD